MSLDSKIEALLDKKLSVGYDVSIPVTKIPETCPIKYLPNLKQPTYIYPLYFPPQPHIAPDLFALIPLIFVFTKKLKSYLIS